MSARRSSINTLDAGDAPVTSRPARPAGKADCARCDAVCCRLTVVLQREDRIPAHLTTFDEHGVEQMARGEDGWCVALDAARMCCSIYNERPSVCRRFVMNGPYCRETRRMYYAPDDRATFPCAWNKQPPMVALDVHGQATHNAWLSPLHALPPTTRID